MTIKPPHSTTGRRAKASAKPSPAPDLLARKFPTKRRSNLSGQRFQAKKLAAWNVLSEENKTWLGLHATDRDNDFVYPLGFDDMPDTRRRILYVLSSTGTEFSLAELVFLFIARWRRNVYVYTIRSRVAEMLLDEDIMAGGNTQRVRLMEGEVLETGEVRYAVTVQGKAALAELTSHHPRTKTSSFDSTTTKERTHTASNRKEHPGRTRAAAKNGKEPRTSRTASHPGNGENAPAPHDSGRKPHPRQAGSPSSPSNSIKRRQGLCNNRKARKINTQQSRGPKSSRFSNRRRRH